MDHALTMNVYQSPGNTRQLEDYSVVNEAMKVGSRTENLRA